jgi:hypothetical protein
MSVARTAGLVAVLVLASAGVAPAATPKEIDAAIKRGADSLKARYGRVAPGDGGLLGGGGTHGIGPTCLAGLALLEAGVPPADPAVKNITQAVRATAYGEAKTYNVALCLMFLDRLGEPADVPLIQILAVRLLAGQNSFGGWGYEVATGLNAGDEQRLRAIKANQQPGKLHPDVEKYGQALFAAKAQSQSMGGDDNSNTQFAVIAVWMARKHGVPVDSALDLIEKRYLAGQSARTGGWPYNGMALAGGAVVADGGFSSPSMHCAGLIGLATGVARREERRAKVDQPKKDDPKKDDPKKNPDDPFFNPPPKAGGADPKKKDEPKRPPDARDRAVQFALAGLGQILTDSVRTGRGSLLLKSDGGHGHHDLYFFWSLERVGVIYGMDKIGGIDWYESGAHTLVHTQAQDGSWGQGGVYGSEVNTSFALLFLCRSNLARDLSSKVQKETATEMRAGAGPAAPDTKPTDPGAATNPKTPDVPPLVLPGVGGSEAAALAGELLRAADKDWPAVLKKLRDAKGATYTAALVIAASRLDGDRLKAAREALAERLTRMTADTLRTMAKAEDVELRRGAVLAMAMKDDKGHLPDLVAALLDDEDAVVRAAKAGLKSLTGQDFGPAANATIGEKKLAADAWREWLSKQKK